MQIMIKTNVTAMNVAIQAVLSLYTPLRTADIVLASSDGVRERMKQIIFESFSAPTMHVSIQAVLYSARQGGRMVSSSTLAEASGSA